MPRRVPQPQKNLQAAIDAFLHDHQGRCLQGARSAATLVMHRVHIGYIVDRIAPTRPLADVDANLIDSFAVAELAGRRRGPRGETIPISPRTLEKRLCTLSLVLQSAQRRGWIDRVPAFPQLRARYVPNREHLRDFAELEQLCDSLPLERADWVWLAVFTGQRPADLERMRAYVDCDPFSRPPWMVLKSGKTRDPDGVFVEMPVPLARRLRVRFAREGLRHGDPVIEPWDKNNRGNMLRRRHRQLGLGAWRATDFRRTCGTWAAHELGSLTIGLKEWMRHRDFGMLSRIYARALPPAFGEVSRALGAMARRRGPRRSEKILLALGNGAPPKESGPEGPGRPTGPSPETRQRNVQRSSTRARVRETSR